MPIVFLARFVTSLLSLLVLGGAAYLLWTWWAGSVVVQPDGDLARVRDDWRLWTGLGLLAWSFMGRFVVTLLLARRDRRASRIRRENGRAVQGPSGSALYVEMHGPAGAPPIIFVHGWGLDSTVWSYAKADLGDRFRLILWDLPGLGRSSKPSRLSLEAFAADLAALVALAGRPPVVVGHSIGGMTIQTLIRDHAGLREKLAGVVLLNTTYTNPLRTIILSRLLLALQRPVLEPMMRLAAALQPLVWLSQWQSYLSGSAHMAHRLGFGKFVTRSQLEHSALLATRNPPAVQAEGNLAMFHWDAAGALASYQGPVLVIGGDMDIITKLQASRDLAEAPNARLEVIEGVNHMGFLERAEAYNQLIGEFAFAAQRTAGSSVTMASPLVASSTRLAGGASPQATQIVS